MTVRLESFQYLPRGSEGWDRRCFISVRFSLRSRVQTVLVRPHHEGRDAGAGA
jgi:hypothetical protein